MGDKGFKRMLAAILVLMSKAIANNLGRIGGKAMLSRNV